VLEKLFSTDKARRAVASRMVGYLVFDALVGNTDRHHQNWGVLLERREDPGHRASFLLQMAPTFDHASSLGRELTDETRLRHLQEGTIDRYIHKGRGGIFENSHAKHGMSPMALARMLAQRYPEFFKSWQKRVRNLQEADSLALLNLVPPERISEPSRAFALAFVSISRRLLQEAL